MGKHGVVVGSINNTASVNTDGFHFNSWGVHRINGHTISMAHLPGKVINVKNCTGAGDSLVGGIVYGLLEGKTIFESCHMGMIAARRSLSSDHAINPDLCPQDLLSESS
jgi:sugar/nucleoside kinase (ribokinase family)